MRYFILILLCFPALCFSVENKNPIDDLIGRGTYHIQSCQMSIRLASEYRKLSIAMGKGLESRDYQDAVKQRAECFDTGRAAVQEKYQSAMQFTSKKKKGGVKVKAYYIAWLTAFEGLVANPDEDEFIHMQRKAANLAKHDEAAMTLRVEFGL